MKFEVIGGAENRHRMVQLPHVPCTQAMNTLFACAAAVAFAVGLAHSLLGERLIFRRLRDTGFIPTQGGQRLGEGHVRILWASWHVLTVFGWAFAALLLWLSFNPAYPGSRFLVQVIVVAMLAGSALVLVGTRARHPGWVGLLAVAVLAWLA